MKISLFILILAFASCTNKNQQSNETSTDFSIRTEKAGFVKDLNSPYVTFKFTGEVTNNTENIYSQVTTRMAIVFTLENGRVLTDAGIAPGSSAFGSTGGLDFLYNLQPSQAQKIENLESEIIGKEYRNYPIKNVALNLFLDVKDEINGTENEQLVKNEDITAEWQKVVNGTVPVDPKYAEIDSSNARILRNEQRGINP